MNRRGLVSGILAAAPLAVLPSQSEAASTERIIFDDEVLFRVSRLEVLQDGQMMTLDSVIVPDGKVKFVHYDLQYASEDMETRVYFTRTPEGSQRLGDALNEAITWCSETMSLPGFPAKLNGTVTIYWAGFVD